MNGETQAPLRWRARPDPLPSAPQMLYRKASFAAESVLAVRNARALVAEAVTDWRLDPVLDDAVLCTSELVTNAVQHAAHPVGHGTGHAGPRQVRVGVYYRRPWTLVIKVADGNTQPPRLPPTPSGNGAPQDAANDTEGCDDGGRGLLLVSTLADRLWWQTCDRGKVVCCRFGIDRRKG